MAGLSVVDASVLIAMFDPGDACHPQAAAALQRSMGQYTLAIPATAFSETLVRPYRAGSTALARAVEARIAALGDVVEVTRDIARRAAELRAKRQIKLPDALILATGQALGAREILTFETRWQGIDRRVRVVGCP